MCLVNCIYSFIVSTSGGQRTTVLSCESLGSNSTARVLTLWAISLAWMESCSIFETGSLLDWLVSSSQRCLSLLLSAGMKEVRQHGVRYKQPQWLIIICDLLVLSIWKIQAFSNTTWGSGEKPSISGRGLEWAMLRQEHTSACWELHVDLFCLGKCFLLRLNGHRESSCQDGGPPLPAQPAPHFKSYWQFSPGFPHFFDVTNDEFISWSLIITRW